MEHGLTRLLGQLSGLQAALDGQTRRRWRRSLPFDDELFDRWERARQLGFGAGTSVYQQCYVYGDVRVGANTWIGPLTILDGSGGLTIGDNCSISAGVHVYTHDTVQWALSGGQAPYESASVTIASCCYIGPHSVVTKGVNIGHHSVIGALSLVNRDIPPHSFAVGQPARVVGRTVIGGDGRVQIVKDPGATS